MYLKEFKWSFIDGERIYNCGSGIVLPSGGHTFQCKGGYMSNVLIENLTGTGVLVYEASPMAFACNMSNMSITNASTAIYIYSSGGKAHLISNSSIYRSQIYDFSTDSHGNIFLNTTFNRSMLRFGGTSNLTVKWYGRVNVTDITNSSLNATITIKNNFSTTVYTSYSNLTPWTIFNDTVYSSANSYSFNNHLISTNKTSYYNNNTLFNFSWRDLTANITMYSVTIPNITFVSPTYPNNTIVYEPINYTYINITSNESLINATLNFSGTIYQMFENTPMNWVINLTSIPFGSYYYSVTGSNQYLSNGTSEIRNITFSPYEEGSLLIFTNQTPTYNSSIYVYVDTQYVNFTNYILNASCLNPLNQTVILSLSNISSLYYDILNLQYEGNYTCQTSAVNQTYSLHNTTSFTVSCPSGYTPFNHICYIHLFLSFNLFTNQTYYDIGDTVLIWCNATRNSTINEIWVFSSSGSPYNMTYLLTKNMWYTYYPISQKQEYITSYSYSDTGQATGFGDIIITYNPSNATDSTWDQIYVGLTFIGLSVGMVVFIIIMIIIFVILAKMFISDKLHIRRPSGSFQTKETSTFNNRFANTMSSSMSGFSSLRNSGGILLQIFFIIISIFIIIAVLLITLYVLDVLNII